MASPGKARTTDLPLAAWWMLHELQLLVCRREPSGKFLICFHDPEGRSDALATEYLNSDCHRFDLEARSLMRIPATTRPRPNQDQDVIYSIDVSISAYWKLRGLEFAFKWLEKGQTEFAFLDPDRRSEALAVEFANSRICRFDLCLRALKKLLSLRNGR